MNGVEENQNQKKKMFSSFSKKKKEINLKNATWLNKIQISRRRDFFSSH